MSTDYGAFLQTYDSADRADDGIDLALLVRMINAWSAPEASVIVILDCCHSGAMQIGNGSVAVALGVDDLLPYLHNFSERLALIASCKENQLADEEVAFEHGVFTFYLLEGLAGEATNADGTLTVNALYDYVAAKFEKNATQRPVYRGDLTGRIILGTGLAHDIATVRR